MVAIVVQELTAPEMCDMTAATNPAITSPTKPVGSSSVTSFGNTRSGRSSAGNNFGAASPGTMMIRGIRKVRYWASTMPRRAWDSSRAAKARWTMNWFVAQ